MQQEGDGQVAVEVAGTGQEILRNWAIMTSEVSERLHIPPVVLGAMLPGAVVGVRNNMNGRVSVDLDAIRRAKEGHNGTGK